MSRSSFENGNGRRYNDGFRNRFDEDIWNRRNYDEDINEFEENINRRHRHAHHHKNNEHQDFHFEFDAHFD